ncbi:MAG: hypothetical protein WBL20_09505 [Sphingobium sp.]|uniref:hypothetical protein n=1 Tax=Sphingobium sp. TaxID=1912891 RepID=UPI003BAEBED1
MAKKYGTALTNVIAGTMEAMAPGSSVNAALRVHREVFNLANLASGDDAVLASVRAGDVVLGMEITGSVDLSGMTFKIGDVADDDRYMTATAGPATPGIPKKVGLTSGIDNDPLDAAREILARLGGTLPGAGTIVVLTFVSHR